jgi:hypothetical protein
VHNCPILSNDIYGAPLTRYRIKSAKFGAEGGMMLRNDFEFVTNLKEEFFAQRKIQLLLATIEKNGTAAWEAWWQVEFARFLYQHQDKHDWAREHLIESGRKKVTEKNKLVADFIIKPRHNAMGRSILLEFKQSDSVTACITNMARDVSKVDKTKSAAIDQRSFWVVGVHPRESKQAVRRTVTRVAAKYGVKIFDVHTRFILNTGLAYTVF